MREVSRDWAQKKRPVKVALKAGARESRLDVGLGFTKTEDALAFLPLTTLFENGHALEALEDVAFNDDAFGTLEAGVLGHEKRRWVVTERIKS